MQINKKCKFCVLIFVCSRLQTFFILSVPVCLVGLLLQTVLAQLFMLHDDLPDKLGSLLDFFRFLEIQRRELGLIDFGEMVAQMIEQHHAFLNAANCRPETFLDIFGESR